MSHLTPVHIALMAFGSRKALAAAAGRTGSAVTQWQKGADSRRAGDFPSISIIRALLRDRRTTGLTVEHLTNGATDTDIQAILAARPPVPGASETSPCDPPRVAGVETNPACVAATTARGSAPEPVTHRRPRGGQTTEDAA